MTAGALHVRRMQNSYLVASAHPDPESLRQRMDEMVRRELPKALERTLAGMEDDERVILIRRLDVDLVLNSQFPPEQLARQWAQSIARELFICLNGTDSREVIQFPDVSAFRAAFLVDLLQGDAWGRWYYQRFDGLRMLPLSAAARTLLCDEETVARAVIVKLPVSVQTQLIATLTAADSGRVVQRLAGTVGAERPSMLLITVTDLLRQHPELLFDSAPEPRLELTLMLAVIRHAGELSGLWITGMLTAVVKLVRLLARQTVMEGERLLDDLLHADQVSLYRQYGSEASSLSPLLQAEAEPLKSLAQWVIQYTAGKTAIPTTGSAESVAAYTRFGGLFLLLPLLASLPLKRMTEDWPSPEVGDAVAMLRLLLAMSALGHSRAAPLFFDPLARDMLGIEAAVSPVHMRQWQQSLSSKQIDTALEYFHDWQRAVGIAGDETQVLSRIRTPSGPVALLIDGAGAWLELTGYRSDRLGRLFSKLSVKRKGRDRCLFVDPALESLLELPWPKPGAILWNDEQLVGTDELPASAAEILARKDKIPEEFHYLSLPGPFQGPRKAALALNIMAHGLLRSLARKLPGFSRASLPYLWANFLDFTASVERQPNRYVVRLGRSPLQLVLAMSGVSRGSVTVPWLPRVVLELYQAE